MQSTENQDLITRLRTEHSQHFDTVGDLLFEAAQALERADRELGRTSAQIIRDASTHYRDAGMSSITPTDLDVLADHHQRAVGGVLQASTRNEVWKRLYYDKRDA